MIRIVAGREVSVINGAVPGAVGFNRMVAILLEALSKKQDSYPAKDAEQTTPTPVLGAFSRIDGD